MPFSGAVEKIKTAGASPRLRNPRRLARGFSLGLAAGCAFAGGMSAAPTDPSEPEAPRRQFRLKVPEIARTDPPSDAPDAGGPIDVQQHLRRAAGPPPRAVPTAAASENDVHGILRTNVAHAKSVGLHAVVPRRRRPSRRKRDYWLVLIGVNLVFVGAAIVGYGNVVTLGFAIGGIIFFSLALTWVMWFVLDDY
jgi:hypothetical protein